MRADEHVHEELVDRFFRVGDLFVLLVVDFSDPKGLQPVQGTLASQGGAAFAFVAPFRAGGIQLPTHGSQQRITTQLIMIAEVLIAQADPDGPLGDQLPERVLDKPRVPAVDEAPRELLEQVAGLIDFPQQQRAGIRGDGAPVERGDHFSAPEPLKTKLFWTTLCIHRWPFSCGVIGFEQANYTTEKGFFLRAYENTGLALNRET